MSYEPHYVHAAINDTVVAVTHRSPRAFTRLAQVSASVRRALRAGQKPTSTQGGCPCAPDRASRADSPAAIGFTYVNLRYIMWHFGIPPAQDAHVQGKARSQVPAGPLPTLHRPVNDDLHQCNAQGIGGGTQEPGQPRSAFANKLPQAKPLLALQKNKLVDKSA